MAEQVNVLLNLANSLVPIEKLVTGAAYVIGIMFVFKSMMLLKSHSESRGQGANSGSIKEPIAYLFVGSLLIYFPSAFSMLLNTMFGYSNVLEYSDPNSQSWLISSLFGPGNELGHDLALIIQIVGVISFVRGWILIAKASAGGQASGAGGMGKGLTHVVGGILAMNIIGTLQVFSNTLTGSS